jgi:hypothetical protein
MPKYPISVAGGAMPADGQPSRRLFLAAGTAAAVCASLRPAAAATVGDDEIIALSAEIRLLDAISADIAEKRIEPFQAQFEEMLNGLSATSRFHRKERVERAFAFSRDCGRDAAIRDQVATEGQADVLFERMTSIPAATHAGRAAKVRALLVHVMRSGWRGPGDSLDWEKAQARALLGEFAGMSAEELADV